MKLKKTFFVGALFLLLLVPTVSHASTFSDVTDWLADMLLGPVVPQTQTAATGALPTTDSWLDIKVSGSDGPVSVADGTRVSVSWFARYLISVKDCTVTYPGQEGRVAKNVSPFGSERLTLYPTKATPNYVEFTCTRNNTVGRDVVAVNTPAASTATTGKKSQASGGSTAGTRTGGTAGQNSSLFGNFMNFGTFQNVRIGGPSNGSNGGSNVLMQTMPGSSGPSPEEQEIQRKALLNDK